MNKKTLEDIFEKGKKFFDNFENFCNILSLLKGMKIFVYNFRLYNSYPSLKEYDIFLGYCSINNEILVRFYDTVTNIEYLYSKLEDKDFAITFLTLILYYATGYILVNSNNKYDNCIYIYPKDIYKLFDYYDIKLIKVYSYKSISLENIF